ncbi:trehalose-6-phosphate synthase, partial [Rhizobium leguminosarum]|uniref:trehalose-6-phosphate synthase n=1 Tax=Rhizobium leguminosarum TaxID=384 RepID=UPI003F94D603
DYHLIPLAAELRQMGLKNRIGFFLHIPWPPADILVTMPVHEEIMRGLSHYDLVANSFPSEIPGKVLEVVVGLEADEIVMREP